MFGIGNRIISNNVNNDDNVKMLMMLTMLIMLVMSIDQMLIMLTMFMILIKLINDDNIDKKILIFELIFSGMRRKSPLPKRPDHNAPRDM